MSRMTDRDFFCIENLQYRLRHAEDRIREFESGERYLKLEQRHRSEARARDSEISRLKSELGRAHAETAAARKNWSEVVDDLYNEHRKEVSALEAENRRLRDRILEVERQRDEALDRLRDRNRDYYEAAARLEDAEQKMAGLTARLNRDYSNSSESSSHSPNHKTIPNGRVKSGRKPGGQKGHIHHGRKALAPTESHEIPAPEAYASDPLYAETGREIHKQLIKLRVGVDVIDYHTKEFRNAETGQRVHAAFPEGLKDEVTYDGSVKAAAYMLNNECYVSIEKTRQFLREISGGAIDLSAGAVCNLSRQFSELTEDERGRIFLELAASDTMHADFTFGRAGGRQAAVIVCASGDLALYQGRARKGDEGVAGSPLECYEGTLISDHEAAIIKHGGRNQECMAHIKRYLLSSTENEKDRKWNSEMLEWLEDSFGHWRRAAAGDDDPDETAELLKRYDGILAVARAEYEDIPPSEYYREGYNLQKRMGENKDAYTLFLLDPSVEPTNNLAERNARKFKRKAAQVMCFRSQEGVNYFCDGLSVLQTLKAQGKDIYDETGRIFNKARC